jgi:Beta-ketoacyl synthase, N-terminal domain
MTTEFSIDRWAAWAPGLEDQAAWEAWFSRQHPLPTQGIPSLTEMPAMMRRRVDRLGRIALQATYACEAEGPAESVVFASRYGELGRSVELLKQLAQTEPLSPTSFSMSVHNAIGALYSIARADPRAYSAVAAGPETVEAAFVEASGQLSDGAESVLVVVYDEPVPDPWQQYSETPDFPRAFACRVRRAGADGCFRLTCHSGEAGPSTGELPADLQILRFLVSGAERFDHRTGHRFWRWQRHA